MPVVVIVFSAVFINTRPPPGPAIVIVRFAVAVVRLTAPEPPVIVPPAKVIVSAVKLMAVLPDELVKTPALLSNVPVPAFAVTPPGPVTVLVLVIPLPVKDTTPDPPAVIALLIVNDEGDWNVILAAPGPVVVIAPPVSILPVLIIDNVPPAAELLAVNVIWRLSSKLILPDVLFVKVTMFAKLLVLLKLIPAPAFTVKLFTPPVPIVKAPDPVIAPVPTPPPTLLKVKLFGVVTALFNVIAPPLV